MFIAIANAIGRSGGSRTDGLTPSNTIAPVISGTASVGSVLTSTTGTWTSDTGITGYLYQWYRGATLITGATNSTYVLTLSDVGFSITCRVAATDIDGTSAYVSSSNSIFLLDADYQAVLTRANALGYPIPSSAQQIVQNQLVLDLKAGGIWNKLDVLYIFANNGGIDFSTLNWKAPTLRQASLNNPLTFTTNQGITGSSSGWINTTFNPTIGTNNYKVADASRYIYVRTQGVSQSLDGVSTGNVNCFVASTSTTPSTSISLFRINQGTSAPTWAGGAVNSNASNQMKSIHRTSSTASRVYLGTTSYDFTNLAGVNALVSLDQLILQRNGVSGDSQISMYSMGANLVAENTAYVNSFNTYINSLV